MAWDISGLGVGWNETAKFINQEISADTGSRRDHYRCLPDSCFLSDDWQWDFCPVRNASDRCHVCMGHGFFKLFQRKLTEFTNSLCRTLDGMIDGSKRPEADMEAETSLARISHRLERLYNIMQMNRRKGEEEKAELQTLVSDISHQTKTPIANLKMINDTMQTRKMPEGKL